ncbi:cyclic nucleotide-binding and patatin-like phospholipase domain-containing protein [Mycobacterium palustre]|uniref:Esterase n=1 Tax=Mycobacterium palustre TaxID=153971 RepID=A0A1X2A0Z5_9MYCO|nr:cyclic nucleotide-binding and patatin-like phospholipase domain-containing protein [Mycobacterium palustre]MCV7104005.1 patatin-like phospholipase family protein [Mycobacterium palustre]ORW34748.1 esterase [Mycobacterium palustre]
MSPDGRSPEPRVTDERTALRGIPIFAEIDDEQLDQLAGAADRQYIPANEWLFHMGEPSDAIYLIASGRFAAVGADGVVLREMATGDSIGELGVITGAARSAGIRALRDGVVWRIAADTFTELLAKAPQLQSAMFRAMAVTLRESRSANVSRGRRVVGVLSAGDAAAGPVVDAIAKRLGSYGQTAVVAPPVDATAAADHYGELVEAFSETLDRLERSNDWLLVVADRGSGDIWRRYVVAQSDRLVVIADQSHPPRALDPPVTQRPVHLVTCRVVPDPSWWDLLQPVSHHPADHDGVGALARRIAGRSMGLVLGGGGARGLAHYGVYEELTRAGVVIDRFGGTSAGALAAATFALGIDADDATAAAREFIAESKPLGDYTLPAIALTRGRRVDRLVEGFFGADTLIERLPKEFFSVSTDIVTGDQVIHRRGLLWIAVRASISIPGLMPPVQHRERLLVDGGLLNILPADVMCADPDGEVICVDLRRTYVPSKGFGPLPERLQPPAVVRRLITGTETALPPLQETLLRSVELAAPKGNLLELPRVTAIIEPDVSAIGPLDFKNIDAALEAGRIATRAALEARPELVR